MDAGYKVLWAPRDELMSCICQQFEFSGILCRHVLRVLSTNNCFHIPNEYLPAQWRCLSYPPRKYSKTTQREHTERDHALRNIVSALLSELVESEERLELASEQISIVLSRIKKFPGPGNAMSDTVYGNPSESLIILEGEDTDGIIQSFTAGNTPDCPTSGKLKERWLREGVDMSRKRRHYPAPCCGQFGHDAADCPMMESERLNGDDLGFM